MQNRHKLFMSAVEFDGSEHFFHAAQLLCCKTCKAGESVGVCTYKTVPALVDNLHLVVIQADIKRDWVVSTDTCSVLVFISWTY